MQPNNGQNYWQGEGGESTPLNTATQNDEVDQKTHESAQPPLEPASWEASEYIHHERDASWTIGFIVITLILLGLSIFLMRSYTFAALIVVMAIALAIYSRRPPRVLKYTLSAQGLEIGQQFHSFKEFRAFGILQEGALYSVILLPTARFGQTTTVYFPESQGEEIVDILGSFLPMEELHLDLVDNLLRRLRL